MRVKTVDGDYHNLLTGSSVSVVKSRSGDDWKVMVLSVMNVPVVCLQTGFKTEQEAKEAMASAFDLLELEPIEVAASVDDDDTEDDEPISDDGLPAYDEMTVEQLKVELAGRPGNLSTSGNKPELINRLAEDDEREMEAN